MKRTNIIPISKVQWEEPAEQSQHWANKNKHKAKHNSEDSLCWSKLWVSFYNCNNASEGQDEVDHQHYKVVYTQRKEKGIRCLHVWRESLSSVLHLHPNRAKTSRTFHRSPGGISSDMLMYIQGWQGHHLGRGGKFLGRAVNTKRIFHIMNTSNISYTFASHCLPLYLQFRASEGSSLCPSVQLLAWPAPINRKQKYCSKHIHANDLVQDSLWKQCTLSLPAILFDTPMPQVRAGIP